MIQCLFLINRQGKTRLTKWYSTSLTTKEKQKFLKEVLIHIFIQNNENFL